MFVYYVRRGLFKLPQVLRPTKNAVNADAALVPTYVNVATKSSKTKLGW